MTGVFFGQNAVDPNATDYQGWTGVLNGCVPDARDLAIATANIGAASRALFSGWNVAGKVIPWVMSGQCTLEAWKNAHADLQAVAKPGDMVIIGNSGHGGQYDTPTEVNGGQFMCFYDGLLYDAEQHELMKAWPAGVNVLYVLDTCYSGGMDRNLLRAPIRSAPLSIKPTTKRVRADMVPSDIVANVVQFCACIPTEEAEDGPQNGAFTGSLLAVWDQANAAGTELTFLSWFDATKALMATSFPDQTPQVNVLGGGEALLALPVYGA